jgi:flagellar hook protein FlgE
MLRSLYSGVSALKNHQVQLDVIGNNIANVNTIGFKASRVSFKEALSQTLKSADAPQSGRGGTNPQQVGLGVEIGSISRIHTQGNLQSTGSLTDVAIEGNGMFVLKDGDSLAFTRAGTFDVDVDGNLYNLSNGLKLMGWVAQAGEIDYKQEIAPIRIPLNEVIEAKATTTINYEGNLDADTNGQLMYHPSPITVSVGGNDVSISYVLTPTGNFNEWQWEVTSSMGTITNGSGILRTNNNGEVIAQDNTNPISIDLGGGLTPITITPPSVGQPSGGSFEVAVGGSPVMSVSGSFTAAESHPASIRVIDSLGSEHNVLVDFNKVGTNSWSWAATDEAGNQIGNGTLTFNSKGAVTSHTGNISFSPPGADPVNIDPKFAITQFAQTSTLQATSQDGYKPGTLESISIDSAGRVNGSFSNGLEQVLAQMAIASFQNYSGLQAVGSTMYIETVNSGKAGIGVANTESRGSIVAKKLEMSNVDLSLEFTNMIVTQRGFQANSRIITTSDEMLQELVNLKR